MPDRCVRISFRIKLTNVTIPRSVKLPSATLGRSRYTVGNLPAVLLHDIWFTDVTRLFEQPAIMQQVDLRALEYTIILEIRPTRRAAPPFPHSFGIPSGIFHETHRRERGSPVNSSGVCVYERATLESGLILEDPRLGAIDRQLDARICRVVGARACTGERVWWCHSYISLESRWNSYARRPTCYYISCSVPPENSNFSRPAFWRRAKTTILGPAVTLHHCAIAREVSRYDTYSSPFHSFKPLCFPFCFRGTPAFLSAQRDISSSR